MGGMTTVAARQAPGARPRPPPARRVGHAGDRPAGSTQPSPTCRSSRRTVTCHPRGSRRTRPSRTRRACSYRRTTTSSASCMPRASPSRSSASADRPMTPEGSRRAWRLLAEHWPAFRGTPSRFWMDSVLADVFGVAERLAPETADAIYDRIRDAIAAPDFRPRALMGRFGIEVLATTDDPADDLRHHRALHADPSFTPRVAPTFRPDRYLEPGRPGFAELMERLAVASGIDTGSYRGYVAALEERRRFFKANGAVSSDHSHADVVTLTLSRRRGGADLRRSAGGCRPATGGDSLPPPHARRDGPDGDRGRPRHDAAPRRAPRPPLPNARTLRTGLGPRHPHDGRVHPGPAAAARPLRHR